MGMIVYLRRATMAEIEVMFAGPDDPDDLFFADAEADVLVDFDKAWHAVHHMLTGSAEATDGPLSIIIDHTKMVGDRGMGFAQYWVISPERMRAFAAALDALSDADLAQRYDPVAMDAERVYLSDVFMDEGADALDYCMENIPSLRRLAAACAATGSGAVKCLA